MKTEILKEIIKKKLSREDFAVLTNLSTSESEIFNSKKLLSNEFKNYENEIKNYYNLKIVVNHQHNYTSHLKITWNLSISFCSKCLAL